MIGNYIRKRAQECIFTMHALGNLSTSLFFLLASLVFVELVVIFVFPPLILMDSGVCITTMSRFLSSASIFLLYTLLAIVVSGGY